MGEKHEKQSKNNAGEKKSDGGGFSTVILGFDMHCKGCAKKVTKSVQKFPGVESVKADCSAGQLIVTGKIVAVKIKEKVEEKMKKSVELVSSQTTKAAAKEGGGNGGGEKKSDDKKQEEKKSEGKSDEKNKFKSKSDEKKKSEGKSGEKKKSEEVKKSDECKKCDDKQPETKEKEKPKEPPVATVVLKTKVHCEGCAQKIKKIVSKCEGVQDVNVDLQKDQITIKGSMNMKELLPFLNTKLKRTVELAESKKDESSGNKDKKKSKEDEKPPEKPKQSTEKVKKPKTSAGDKKETGGEKKDEKKEGGGEKKKGDKSGEAGLSKDNSNSTKIAINKMEYNPYGYDNRYFSYTDDPRQEGGEGYGHQVVEYWHGQEYPQPPQPPQLFSDENPNACSIM